MSTSEKIFENTANNASDMHTISKPAEPMAKTDFIDAFGKLYKDTPIEKITVRRITELTGYNRSTFYKYFTDVYAIREFLEQHIIQIIKTTLKSVIPVTEFTANFLVGFTKLHRYEAKYMDILFKGINGHHFANLLQEELSAYWLTLFLNASMTTSVTPEQRYAIHIYFATVISAVQAWINNERDMELDEFAQYMNRILTGGIVNCLHSVF